MTTSVGRRPALITLLVVLVILAAIGWIITGIVVMTSFGGVQFAGIIFIVLGVVYLAVAKGLLDGNPIARIVVSIVAVLQVAWAIIDLFVKQREYADSNTSSVASGVVALIILIVLFSPSANAFFRSRST